MMFECYKEEVKIKDIKGNEFTYELKPLSGRWLPKLYRVMKGFGAMDNKELEITDIDENVMGDLHELALETLKSSYPKEEESTLDSWVSQNLMSLVEPLIKVNLGFKSSDKKE